MSFAPAFLRVSFDLVQPVCGLFRRHPLGSALLAAALSLPCLSPTAQAQSYGGEDPNFVVAVTNLTVFTVNLQLDVNGAEQIIAGGDTLELARFALNGTGDANFGLPATFGGTNRTVYTLAFERTVANTSVGEYASRIYIGGNFGQFAADSIPQNIVRINYDGSLDSNFNPGNGANDEVTAILPLSGTIGSPLIVGGLFTRFGGQEHDYLVKLNADGSVDSTYNPALSVGDTVFSLAQQIDGSTGLPNGQVLVTGAFNRINKGLPAKLARLNSDGTTDTSFLPDFPTRTLAVAVQPDGKIVVGGSFDTVNGLPAGNLVRLNQDGTTDPTFSANVSGNVDPANAPPTAVNTVLIGPDGAIYAAGNFLKANGVPRVNLARFKPDGTLDLTFDPGTLLQNRVQSIALQTDNNLVIGETRINRATDSSPYPNDLVRVLGGPPLPASVSIEATLSKAQQGSKTIGVKRTSGQVEIIRTGPFINPLTVFFAEGGTAMFGTQYKLVGDVFSGAAITDQAITIPSDQDRVLINVVPANNFPPGNQKLKAKIILSPSLDGSYEIDGTGSATVKLLPAIP